MVARTDRGGAKTERIACAEGLTPVGGGRHADDEPLAWRLDGWSGLEKSI